jgi:hypothetical protein
VEVECNRCLISRTQRLWKVLSPSTAVVAVQKAKRHNEKHFLQEHNTAHPLVWINPSKSLLNCALNRSSAEGLLADNTNAVTLMLGSPGPPRAPVL